MNLVKIQMAKKQSKEFEYRTILDRRGISYQNCQVLAFYFERAKGAETFHLNLMMDSRRPLYWLFDCVGNNGIVITSKDAENAAIISDIASRNGGVKTIPDLS